VTHFASPEVPLDAPGVECYDLYSVTLRSKMPAETTEPMMDWGVKLYSLTRWTGGTLRRMMCLFSSQLATVKHQNWSFSDYKSDYSFTRPMLFDCMFSIVLCCGFCKNSHTVSSKTTKSSYFTRKIHRKHALLWNV